MPWRRAKFQGKDVWVEVDAAGALVAARGLVSMRYSDKAGAKLYRGGVAKIGGLEGECLDLPDRDAATSGGGRGNASGFGSAGKRTAAQASAAQSAAQDLIAAVDGDTVVAYTDGGCRRNPGPAGAGVRVEFPDGRIAERSVSLGQGTNNIAELAAIGAALDLLDEAAWPASAPVVLLSDSTYARGVLTQGWKAKANVEQIAALRERLRARKGVTMRWVAGHAGVFGNERADALATAGINGRTATDWSTRAP